MQNKNVVKIIKMKSNDNIREILGDLDNNAKLIEHEFGVRLNIEDGNILIEGDELNVSLADTLINNLENMIVNNGKIDKQSLRYAIDLVLEGNKQKLGEILNDIICISASGKSVKPKTLGQKLYVDSIRKNDIVFGIGPAGTGKTYLAMAMAVKSLKEKKINKIILTRPAVEAGESLGFLPGDLQDKVDPYLRPIYDALFDILGPDSFATYFEKGIIEVAPLAYMRGRTLDASFVILDEAQNTTYEQMKMFLTRLGFGSKAIITGDITQIDLNRGKKSGLVAITKILNDINRIDFVYLSKKDVIRHPLIQKIIDAYEDYEESDSTTERN